MSKSVPVHVALLPALTLTVSSPIIARPRANVLFAVIASVVPGSMPSALPPVPMFASDETLSVPAEIVVPPLY